MSAEPLRILVVANETVVGEPLLEKIRERARQGHPSFLIICPQSDATSGAHPEAERRLRRQSEEHVHVAEAEVRIDQCDGASEPRERDGKVQRHVGLADSALAARDGKHALPPLWKRRRHAVAPWRESPATHAASSGGVARSRSSGTF